MRGGEDESKLASGASISIRKCRTMTLMVRGVRARTDPTVPALVLFVENVVAYLGPFPLVDRFPQRTLESVPVRRFSGKRDASHVLEEKGGKTDRGVGPLAGSSGPDRQRASEKVI